ncbi:MAG: ScpA family protein [Bradymonadaceae bacterium]
MPTPADNQTRSGAADETEEEAPAELQLHLPDFEGPLDLLLELVRDKEIDIVEIPIARITEEYLHCVERMEKLDLELGAEWLEMASRLLYLKSRTLVPDDDEGDEEEGPDPKEELVRRLVLYEKYKTLAEKLDARPKLDRDVFSPPERTDRFRDSSNPPDLREAELDDLIGALRAMLDRTGSRPELVYEMDSQKLSLKQVVLDVADRLEETPRLTFDELFDGDSPSRNRVVTTFVALLEMARLELVQLFQKRLGGPDRLHVERAVIDPDEVNQRLDLSEELT